MHIFLQQRGPSGEDPMLPISHFHLPKATKAAFEPAVFVASAIVGRNPVSNKRWLACMGQDADGNRSCFYFELRQYEGRLVADGSKNINEYPANEAEQVIHLAAEVRLEMVLAMIGTAGKEEQNGLH